MSSKSDINLASHNIPKLNENGEELFTLEEVFPDSHPGHILRGLRTREDLTQARFAEMAGLKLHHISEMEHGRRAIGVDMARRLARALHPDHRLLLSTAMRCSTIA